MKLLKNIALFTLLCVSVQANSKETKKYDDILALHIQAEKPGVAAIVIKNNKIIYRSAYGVADMTSGEKLTADHIFKIGSITKQFTSAAIMLLQEQGKLSIADNIHKYVPSFPTEGNVITIKHLLNHTSGIANYLNNAKIMNELIEKPATIDEILTAFSDDAMLFKPGEKTSYSNTAYVILGKIIEVASGDSYGDFITKNIFKKLSMKHSGYLSEKTIPMAAKGYTQGESAIEVPRKINMNWVYSAGALYSSVDDLAIWFHALRNGKLITKESYQQMITKTVHNDKSESIYGFGLHHSKEIDLNEIAHGGWILGFNGFSAYYPEEDIYIAVLSNNDATMPTTRSIRVKLLALALGNKLPSFKAITLADEHLKKYIGQYQFNETTQRKFIVKNGQAFTQRNDGQLFKVMPMSKSSFYYENLIDYIVFKKDNDGKIQMNFHSGLAETAITAPQS